jgi:hypothetical protein
MESHDDAIFPKPPQSYVECENGIDEAIADDHEITVPYQSSVVADPTRRRSRHGSRNQHKMKYFVKWVIETFLNSQCDDNDSTATQRNNHHILDVAGGKGELSARLIMCSNKNIHITMVDPRIANIPLVYHNWIVPKLPKKWQQQYEKQCQENSNFIEDIVNKRFIQLDTYFTNETIQSNIELRTAIESCTLMIGMHADSATECIVDVALQYHKPFVVVPCCVFPNLFPQRFIKKSTVSSVSRIDGQTSTIINESNETCTNIMIPVRTYEQFCDYLHQKDKRFHRTILPFDGRNIAIWWDGGK